MIKFSIIVPTLNSYFLLKNLIKSIKSQTWQNWDLVFIDGGSEKPHLSFIKKVCKSEKRFCFFKQTEERKDIFGAMNQGIDMVDKNSWIIFLGSDDEFLDKYVLENLNSVITNLNLHSQDLIISRGRYFDIEKNNFSRDAYFKNLKKESFLNSRDYKKLLFKGFTPPHQTTLFNGLSIINKYYNSNFKIAGDLEYFCRISLNEKLSVTTLPIETIKIRTGGISDKKHFNRTKEVIKCYFMYFKFLFIIPLILRYLNRLKQLLWMK